MSDGEWPRAAISTRVFGRICAACFALMLMMTSGFAHAQEQSPRSRAVDIRSAAWTSDENFFAAVVGSDGSNSALDMSVVVWDVRTGRIMDRKRLPDLARRNEESSSIFIHAMAVFATRYADKDDFRVAISTSLKGQVSGTCSNLILRGALGSRHWGLPDEDVNTPASCRAKDPLKLVSPTGKFTVAAQGNGMAVFLSGTRGLLHALESPKAFPLADRPPGFAGSGDAAFQRYPEIVLQSQFSAEEAKLAVWTPDEKFVVAIFGIKGSVAAREHSLVVWDFRSGDIVNRVALPDLGSDSSIFVHNIYINRGSEIELRASIDGADGEPCESIILVNRLDQTAGWRQRADLNRPALCEVEYPPNPRSPSGRYGLSETQSPLAVVHPGTREIFAALDKPEALAIADAALSPDGKTMAIVPGRAPNSESSPPIVLFDLASSRIREIPLASGEAYDRVHWLDEERFVLLSRAGTGPIPTFVAATGKEAGPRGAGQCLSGQRGETFALGAVAIRCRKPARGDPPAPDHVQLLAGLATDSIRIEYDEPNGAVHAIRTNPDQVRRKVLGQNVVAAGKVPNSPLSWFATPRAGLFWSGLALYDRGDEIPLPVVHFFPGGKFFMQHGFGYDTNLSADTGLFRWIEVGDGLSTLGPQTFMRTAFQPQLIRRMIECERSQTCDERFNADIPRIKTTLPVVTIDRVVPGGEPNTAIVEISVSGGKGSGRPGFDDGTGAYNLRLFRDGALVAQYPKLGVDEDLSEIETWRERNLVTNDADGAQRVSLPVVLPTGSEAQTIALTAYAFNEDRVKSETARAEYAQPAVAKPRKRRAFVVTFGIDDYDDEKLSDLQFAGNDARLLGERLARIPGYEVHQAIIARDPKSKKPVKVTQLTIARVIAILRGVEVKASKKALRNQGFDASMLEPPTPDDIVILSFAGHGWADKNGAFYIVPSDARWLAKDQPDRKSLISAVQMADRLRDVDAGEMAMIIDACHSAASVDGGGFKPGPMGDPGLGQLAFDKGIRILAATQADDVALEDPVLRQGLLTYALASEGITADGGQAEADDNGDGRIMLDEWLRYATRRMPSLSSDVRLGRLTTTATGARGWVSVGATPPDIQEPALFDFTSGPSKIVLREGIGR